MLEDFVSREPLIKQGLGDPGLEVARQGSRGRPQVYGVLNWQGIHLGGEGSHLIGLLRT